MGENVTSKGGQVKPGEAVSLEWTEPDEGDIEAKSCRRSYVSLLDTWAKSGPGRREGKGKGPEVE